MKIRFLIGSGIVVLATSVLATGTALAQSVPISGSAGPVALPNVPVQVCVNGTCQSTPPLSSATLNATLTPDATAGVPTVTPGLCTSGIGPTLIVNSGSSSATLGGTLTGVLPTGLPFFQALPPLTIPANGSATISACTSVTPPVTVPPVTVPPVTVPPVTVPPVPGLGGILGIILNLLQSLLGGFGGLPGLPPLP